jgi:predicted acyltransferase
MTAASQAHQQVNQQATLPTGGRLLALDLFRGLTILLMVIVNSPDLTGQWHHAYWDGATIADWVFPWFLLIVGVSLAVNEPKMRQQRQLLGDGALLWGIAKRTLQLFALGLLVNLFYTDFSAVRVLGVLQRIAIVYFCCAVLLLYLSRQRILTLGVVLLLGYWALLSFVQFPGAVVGDLSRGNTVVNLFDQHFLPGKLWRGHWDPEGLLSTLPSIVTGITGLWAGWLLQGVTALSKAQAQTQSQAFRRWVQLFAAGVLLSLLGYGWSQDSWLGSYAFPLIKQIWTSSFVLYTSGLGFIGFVLLQVFYQQAGSRLWAEPVVYVLKVLGMNATVLYLWHVVLHYLLTQNWWWHFNGTAPDRALSFYGWLTQTSAGPAGTATAWYLLIFITLSILPNFWLYQRRIFIKL